MAYIVSVPIAFEFRPRRVRWSLLQRTDGSVLQPTMIGGPLIKLDDAWAMRKDFFHIRRGDTDALLKFLNKWGKWRAGNAPMLERVAELWEKYDLLRSAVRGPLSEWMKDAANGLLRHADPRVEYPYHVLTTFGCEQAIRATITLDLLHKEKFAICARPDCRAPFQIESQHKRKYCSQYCGHIESVRKQRRDAKRESEQLAKAEVKRKLRN